MKKGFTIKKNEYFNCCGVDIMAFSDFYPAGHQSGVTVIMNEKRIGANGDIRFEQTPGQWQPVPKKLERKVDEENNTISTTLRYPDMDPYLHGFNPIIYPDFEFEYEVVVAGGENGVRVTVNLDRPVPEEFFGKLGFNLELFPGELFGKSYIMDDETGIFPRQANAPTKRVKSNYEHSGHIKPYDVAKASKEMLSGYNKGYQPIVADDLIALPYASGHCFTLCPENELLSFTVESKEALINLYDGRMNHNNGWFVLNSEIPLGKTKEALVWEIRPVVSEDFIKAPTVQTSQVGYHPAQPKKAYIELAENDKSVHKIILEKLSVDGIKTVVESDGIDSGNFLRYRYLTFDFSDIKEEGLYRITYGDSKSSVFRIAKNVYDRGVWQPVLEYFLPVQMCHMRVNEKYRVWHGKCHCDDARMAPVNYEQFDGAAQGPETWTKYKSGEHIPGVNKGGWHDAGDFDLRIESQTGEMFAMSMAYEEFGVDFDETTIDQENQIVEIHEPDGKNDILQQIEHGALSVIGAYKSLGRLYHEIMAGSLRQYVLLGDAANMTPGIPDNEEERFLFTEKNPPRELMAAAHLAASYRALKDLNEELAKDCLGVAEEIYSITEPVEVKHIKNDYAPINTKIDFYRNSKVQASVELFLSTGNEKYKEYILDNLTYILDNIAMLGWMLCRCIHKLENEEALAKTKEAMRTYRKKMDSECSETPYGIPYRPNIWGAGWDIQRKGMNYYFLRKAFPDIFEADMLFDSLNFILGCHPGSNTSSFASGVGAKSTTTAYGANRADWSYIPGGVVSGTALIRPDLPELLEFPFLWQQMEYVLGGGSLNYMFLVLAVINEFK